MASSNKKLKDIKQGDMVNIINILSRQVVEIAYVKDVIPEKYAILTNGMFFDVSCGEDFEVSINLIHIVYAPEKEKESMNHFFSMIDKKTNEMKAMGRRYILGRFKAMMSIENKLHENVDARIEIDLKTLYLVRSLLYFMSENDVKEASSSTTLVWAIGDIRYTISTKIHLQAYYDSFIRINMKGASITFNSGVINFNVETVAQTIEEFIQSLHKSVYKIFMQEENKQEEAR